MILVTGAAGKTGRAIIRALVGRGAVVRALCHRAEQAENLQGMGIRETVVGDMRNPATWNSSLHDANAVYHICPNLSPDEVDIGRLAIKSAGRERVSHFVYHSVLHPQIEPMSHHWQKLRVEEALFESGLPYTILQPAAYMQNVLPHWEEIVLHGTYSIPYGEETRIGMVDLDDVAAAAALVTMCPDHDGATYELAGPEALTQTAIAAVLSEVLKRPIALKVSPPDDRGLGSGDPRLEAYLRATLIAMFRYYDEHGFWGNSRVLGWLLGRDPTTFREFAERTAAENSSVPPQN